MTESPNPANDEPDLADLAWEFDLSMQAGSADSIVDWLAGRSQPVSATTAFVLARCGCEARQFDFSWLKRELSDPRLPFNADQDRIALLRELFRDQVAAKRLAAWQDFQPFGFSPEQLQLRMVDEPVCLGDVVADRFRLAERLGAGGCGVVYGGITLVDGKLVALKAPLLGETENEGERFQSLLRQEATVMRELPISGTPAFLELCELAPGRPLLVSERIYGDSLASRLENSSLEESEALRVAGRVAMILDAAHQRGYLHGDLKPANVMMTASGEPVLLDFGLARQDDPRHVREGRQPGTLPFMSPESLAGVAADTDVRQDVWALGAFLYQLLSGRPLHVAANVESALVSAVLLGGEHPVTLPETVSPAAVRICRQALARQPFARWETASDFSVACEAALLGRPVQLPPREKLTAWRLGIEMGRMCAYQRRLSEATHATPVRADVLSAMAVATTHEGVACLSERLSLSIDPWPESKAYRLAFYVTKGSKADDFATAVARTDQWCQATRDAVEGQLTERSTSLRELFQLGVATRLMAIDRESRNQWLDLVARSSLNAAELDPFESAKSSLLEDPANVGGLEYDVPRQLRWHDSDG